MTHRWLSVAVIMALAVVFETGCATKKYVRNRIAERVTPLENRTGELEETSRRNTQQIAELRTNIDEVRNRADKAQSTADAAAAAAEQANTRVTNVEHSVEDLRSNLDKYTVQNRASVFFRPSTARLTPEAMAQLDMLASQITDRNGFALEIVGYGDTARPSVYNQNLAQLRAEAVQRYLADRRNIPVMRMFALGFGAARPATPGGGTMSNVSTSDSSSGAARALNRRVEIRLLVNSAVPAAPMRTSSTGASSNPAAKTP